MWPLIEAKKGDWYSASLPSSSLHGIQGYRVRTYLNTLQYYTCIKYTKNLIYTCVLL